MIGRQSTNRGRVEARAITEEVGARPGEVAVCRLVVQNAGSTAVPLLVRVHGLGHSSSYAPIAGEPLEAGQQVEVEVPLEVPESFGVGQHALAVEIGSGRPGDESALVHVQLTIGSPAAISPVINPSLIRGGRRVKFEVEVENRANVPTTVDLAGTGPDLRVRLDRTQVAIAPGATASVRGKIRGPRRWVGDPAQHVLTVEARASSVPSYATASYRQRALVPRRARGGMIGVAFLLLWALIAAAVVLLWARRDEPSDADVNAATEVDGTSLTPLTNPDGTPADGSTGSDGSGGSGGGSGGSGGAGGGAAASAPTETILRGRVKAGDEGAREGVLVTLIPTTPGEGLQITGEVTDVSSEAAGVLQPGGPGSGMRVEHVAAPAATSTGAPVKFWPARYGTYEAGRLTDLRTLSVASIASGADGSWQFQQVSLRRSYEISFAKAGFNTRAFIVSPNADGKPIELDVDLEPADGSLGGVVTGPSGPAQVAVTDGTLTFSSTTSTASGSQGRWAIDGVSTPGTYTITITSPGFGTEVMQVRLEAGESRTNLNLNLRADVGSISGAVSNAEGPLGGATLVATTGDQTITTTSVTEGATGSFNFPQLALGSTYTVTASADGYITQTRSVTVSGNTTGIDFTLIKSTASIIGRVMSSRDGQVVPLVSAAVTVSAGDLEVRSSSAAAPDAGAFNVTDLPPGTYVLSASRYDHPAVTQLLTLTAGQVFDAGEIVLDYVPRVGVTQTGSVVVRTFDSFGVELPGATVQLVDVGGHIPVQAKTMAATESSVSFTAVPIGTYQIRVTKSQYRPTTVNQVSVGLGPVERQVTMLQYGTARGTVIDAVAGFADPSPPLLDDNDHPVYATPDGTRVFFDPNATTTLPPESETGPNAVSAYVDAAGRTVVRYADGSLKRLGVGDAPAEPLTPVLETVGNVPLSNYELLLYRMNGTVRVCIGPIVSKDAEWEIDPSMQLLSGDYVLRFEPLGGEVGTNCTARGVAPAGFAAIAANTDLDVASFTISESLDEKVVLSPIRVAPYPAVTGQVLIPLNAGGFADFTASDPSQLHVTLTCNGASTEMAITSGSSGEVLFGQTREQIQQLFESTTGPLTFQPAAGDLPPCTISASYGGAETFVPVEHTMALQVGLGDTGPAPGAYTDRVLSIGLVRDPGTILGVVQWTDPGAETGLGEQTTFPVGGAIVESQRPVTIGVTTTDEPNPGGPTTSITPSDPDAVTATVGAAADSAGRFVFDNDGQRQVLGTELYRVSASRYVTRETATPPPPDTAMSVAVHDDGTWTATSADGGVTSALGSATVPLAADPDPNGFPGHATITSLRGQAAAGELTVGATAPGSSTADPLTVAGSGFQVAAPALAGTWQFDYGIAAGSNLLITSAASERTFVPPGGEATSPSPPQPPFTSGFVEPSVTAVELGDAVVNMFDGVQPIAEPGMSVTLSQVPPGVATLPADPWSDRTLTLGSGIVAGVAHLGRLPVTADSAITPTITYSLSLNIPFHDETKSTITVTELNPDGSDGTAQTYTGTWSGIEFQVRAGSRFRVDVTSPGYGRITGRLQGQTQHAALGADPVPLVPNGTTITVTALRADDGETFDLPAVGTDGTFSERLRAGTYTLTFHAENYQDVTGVVVELDPLEDVRHDCTGAPAGCIEQATLGQVLQLKTQTFVLHARDGVDADAAPVGGATVQLWVVDYDPLDPPDGNPQYPIPAATTTDAATGDLTIAGVYPGTYTLVVHKRAGVAPDVHDVNFPVIATVTIPTTNESAPDPIEVRVAMPTIGGSISGTVMAISSADRAVPLPAGVSVRRSFDLAQIDTGDVTNTLTEADLQPPPVREIPITGSSPFAYEFASLPYGTHVLTFDPAPAGYTLAPSGPQDVVVGGDEEGHDAVYRAEDVDVTIRVVDAAAPSTILAGATVQLVGSGGQANPGTAPVPPGAAGYLFENVPPDLVGYTLKVSVPGYSARADTSLVVNPSATGTQTETVQLTKTATITGIARIENAGGTSAAPSVILHRTDAAATDKTTTADATTHRFTFEVDAADFGSYEVRVEPNGYKPARATVNAGAVIAAGGNYDVGVLLARQWATATISVTTPFPTLPAKPTTLLVEPEAAYTGNGTSANPYVISQLDPGVSYSITVQHPDYADNIVFTGQPTPGQAILRTNVALVPRSATATITVQIPGGGTIAGLDFAESGGTVNETGAPVFVVTDLTPGTAYTFTITSTNYETRTLNLTPTANQQFTQTVTLDPKPTATITVQVAGGGSIAGLSFATSGGVPDTSGSPVFVVRQLTAGTPYTFTITSTNYVTKTINLTPTANQQYTETVTLDPKPSTVNVTVTGGPSDLSTVSVTGSAGAGTGVRTDNVWKFTITTPGSYTFTASATGFTTTDTGAFDVGPNVTIDKPLNLVATGGGGE